MVRRDKHLHIRLNEHEFEVIENIAERMDMKKSEFGREAIRRYIRELEQPSRPSEVQLTENLINSVATAIIERTLAMQQQSLKDLGKNVGKSRNPK